LFCQTGPERFQSNQNQIKSLFTMQMNVGTIKSSRKGVPEIEFPVKPRRCLMRKLYLASASGLI